MTTPKRDRRTIEIPWRGCLARKKSTGNLCKAGAIPFTHYCRIHLGKTVEQAKFEVLPAMELAQWGIDDTTVDPALTLLRLVSQSARRCAFYGQLLGATYKAAEAKDEQERSDNLKSLVKVAGVSALIGARKAATAHGDIYQAEEVIRALVQLEGAERDRCANFAAKAIQAGIAERAISIAEDQAAAIVSLMMASLNDPTVGLTPAQRGNALRVIEGKVAELEAAESDG